MNNPPEATTKTDRPDFKIVGLNYVSIYAKDYEAILAFYGHVFGPADWTSPDEGIHGWRMGSTWLTIFPSAQGTHKDSNPRNAEFAIQVATPDKVDQLYQTLIEAGAKHCHRPEDTEMYDPMRFGCVDDPFGMRIDIYCPLSKGEADE